MLSHWRHGAWYVTHNGLPVRSELHIHVHIFPWWTNVETRHLSHVLVSILLNDYFIASLFSLRRSHPFFSILTLHFADTSLRKRSYEMSPTSSFHHQSQVEEVFMQLSKVNWPNYAVKHVLLPHPAIFLLQWVFLCIIYFSFSLGCILHIGLYVRL